MKTIRFRLVKGDPQSVPIRGIFEARVLRKEKNGSLTTLQVEVIKKPNTEYEIDEISKNSKAFDKRWYVGDGDYYVNLI